MANVKTTEGKTEYSGFSDLNLGIGYAGRWTDIPEQSLLLLSKQCRHSGGSGVIGWPNHSVKPAIEKEARLRPQHFTFGSGAGLNNQGSLWRN